MPSEGQGRARLELAPQATHGDERCAPPSHLRHDLIPLHQALASINQDVVQGRLIGVPTAGYRRGVLPLNRPAARPSQQAHNTSTCRGQGCLAIRFASGEGEASTITSARPKRKKKPQHMPTTDRSNMNIKQLGRRARIGIAAVIAAIGVAFPIVNASSASASTYYSINVDRQCQDQYHGYFYRGVAYNRNNPFSWVCGYASHSLTIGYPWGASYTISITPVGGVDMQAYCSRYYPGSRAILVNWTSTGWRCLR
jgi:hypothetical protein